MNPIWGTISGPFAAAAHATMACNNEIPPLLPIPPVGQDAILGPAHTLPRGHKAKPKVSYYLLPEGLIFVILAA